MKKEKRKKIFIYQILCKRGHIFNKEYFTDEEKFKNSLLVLVKCGFDCQCKMIVKEVDL